MAPMGVVVQSALVDFEDMTNETEEFVVKAPQQVGEYAWSIVFPRHEFEGVVHEESSLTISSTTTPHPTSIAVWEVPSPVVVNSSFKVRVGVKCSVACQLTGQLIVVRDEAAIKVGEGRLGDTPWPGTSALYGAEVNLAAPAGEGMYSWFVTAAGAESEMPHGDASATFSFRTARPPEHRVTVTVIERGHGGAPRECPGPIGRLSSLDRRAWAGQPRGGRGQIPPQSVEGWLRDALQDRGDHGECHNPGHGCVRSRQRSR